MIINPARTTRHNLANQAAPAYFLVRKRGTCGKLSTTRQLRQYGHCICKAAASKKQPFGEGKAEPPQLLACRMEVRGKRDALAEKCLKTPPGT